MSVKSKVVSSALALSCLLGVGGFYLASVSPASAAVDPGVQTGIDDSIETVQALSGLSLAALTVALTPLGAMLTLRFLNMVLSRV